MTNDKDDQAADSVTAPGIQSRTASSQDSSGGSSPTGILSEGDVSGDGNASETRDGGQVQGNPGHDVDGEGASKPFGAGAIEKAPSPTPTAEPKSGLIKSTAIVSAATTASRFLGLIREQLFAALMGAGFWADAFVVAFRIPNLLRDLFAEGALAAAFVPTFTKAEKDKGPEFANGLANRVVGALLLLVGLLTLLGILFADQLVFLLASGFSEVPGKRELTATLARIMMPFLPAISLAAVMMGMLNARKSFGVPALAPAMFNLTAIATGVALKLFGATDRAAVVGWSVGTLLGGLAQFAVQLRPLKRFGYAFRPSFRNLWKDEDLRHIAFLMGPAVLGLAATEANIFINTQFASQEQGANAWLNYAFRLMYLPIGIFGVAVATVTTTSLARRAAEKDLAGMKKSLAEGLQLIAFLALPSMVGLMVLAEPVIRLVYQYGRFTGDDVSHTALALQGYAFGLFAYSSVKVTAPAFYALGRPKIPLVGSVSAVATNLVLNLVLFSRIGYLGLALGTALGAWVNLTILATAFSRQTREHRLPEGFFGQIFRMAVAAAIMGAAVFFSLKGMDGLLHAAGFGSRLFWVKCVRALGGVAVGVLAYGALAFAFRISMLRETLDALVRRLRRRKAKSHG